MWRFYFRNSGFWDYGYKDALSCYVHMMHSDSVSHRRRSFPCFTDTSWLFDLYRHKTLKWICAQVSLIWKEDAISLISHSLVFVFIYLKFLQVNPGPPFIAVTLTSESHLLYCKSWWCQKDDAWRIQPCLAVSFLHFVSQYLIMMLFSNTANKSKRLRSADVYVWHLLDIHITQPTSSVRLTVNRGLRAIHTGPSTSPCQSPELQVIPVPDVTKTPFQGGLVDLAQRRLNTEIGEIIPRD